MKKKENSRDSLGDHHVYPTSRFKIKKPRTKHNAWHALFKNKTPEEAMAQVNGWTTKNGDLRKLKEYRVIAWRVLFGTGASPAKAIQIIEEKWMVPGVKMIFFKKKK